MICNGEPSHWGVRLQMDEEGDCRQGMDQKTIVKVSYVYLFVSFFKYRIAHCILHQ